MYFIESLAHNLASNMAFVPAKYRFSQKRAARTLQRRGSEKNFFGKQQADNDNNGK